MPTHYSKCMESFAEEPYSFNRYLVPKKDALTMPKKLG